jgi:two-component system, OmpR family, phosphate regulon sensor histidine kinase PhoR
MSGSPPLLPRWLPGLWIGIVVVAGVGVAAAMGASPWMCALVGMVLLVVMGAVLSFRWAELRGRLSRVGAEAELLGKAIGRNRARKDQYDELRDPWGELAGALEDVRTELERHVHALNRERRDLQTIVDAVDGPVLATDADGVIRLCNAAGRAIFSSVAFPASPPLLPDGRLVEEVFTQPDILVIHGRALRGERSTKRLRIAVSDGQIRIFEVTAAPAELTTEEEAPRRPGDTDASGVVLTLRDVTELATAMQLKTDFVANASHELRTPLASIRAAAETLTTLEPDEHAMRQRVLTMLERNAQRLEEMVRDLLDLARLESPEAEVQRKAIDMGEVAGQLAVLYEPQCAQRRLELRFEISPEARTLRSDPRLVSLIIKNLVENALKFAHEGTAIRVRALATHEPGRTPTLSGEQPASTLRLEVIDRGVGIPLNQQARIFERFFQVDTARSGHPQKRGTGLGLAIVKHSVRALEGRVWVESIYGEGTTMLVELPGSILPPDPALDETLWGLDALVGEQPEGKEDH